MYTPLYLYIRYIKFIFLKNVLLSHSLSVKPSVAPLHLCLQSKFHPRSIMCKTPTSTAPQIWPQHSHTWNSQLANKHMETCSASLAIRLRKWKPQWDTTIQPIEWLKWKRLKAMWLQATFLCHLITPFTNSQLQTGPLPLLWRPSPSCFSMLPASPLKCPGGRQTSLPVTSCCPHPNPLNLCVTLNDKGAWRRSLKWGDYARLSRGAFKCGREEQKRRSGWCDRNSIQYCCFEDGTRGQQVKKMGNL